MKRARPLQDKTDQELIHILSSALSYILRFSSINHKWPVQKQRILDLCYEANVRVGAISEQKTNDNGS